MLEDEGFVTELAGVRLLGRDVAGTCKEHCLLRIHGIFNSERLTADIITQLNQFCDPFGDRPDRAETLLNHFHRGVTDRRR